MIRKLSRCIPFLALALLLAAPTASWAIDLSGTWSGSWGSNQTRHKGVLHAEFVRIGQSQYEVFFRGRFFKILPFKYSVVMTAVEQDGMVQLSGSQHLGRMFGTFTFAAAANDCQFNANYYSCKDDGYFAMTRCTRAVSCYEK
jgi:hypothetical protein